MTNTPGDQPTPPEPQEPGQDPPGYWGQQPEQSGQPQQSEQPEQPTAPYAQQPYAQGPPPGYPARGPVQYAPDHPKATTSLVLGILGLVLCGVIAPFAWAIGKKTLDEIDASNGMVGGRGAAQAGYILGIVGTVLLVLGVVIVAIYAIGMVALVNTGMTSDL